MKQLSAFLGLVFLLGVVGASSDAYGQKKKEAVVWPASDVKWMEMKGGPPGFSYANLWGDMMKGGYGALVKLPAGRTNELHTHSADVHVVVISGTFLFTPEGGTEQRLGPGSYLMVPGKLKHTSGVSSDGPCELFQYSTGKWDVVPVAMKK